ncbi:glycosyl hydrolase family 49 domain-containing protein [Trichoderma pleuroticola]
MTRMTRYTFLQGFGATGSSSEPGTNCQTDGLQLNPSSTMRDVFYHCNNDAIKACHGQVDIERVTVWKIHNDPVDQMGWDYEGGEQFQEAARRVHYQCGLQRSLPGLAEDFASAEPSAQDQQRGVSTRTKPSCRNCSKLRRGS